MITFSHYQLFILQMEICHDELQLIYSHEPLNPVHFVCGFCVCVCIVYFPRPVPSLCSNSCVHSPAQHSTDVHQILDKPEHLLDVMKSYSVKTGHISALIANRNVNVMFHVSLMSI